jgi:hypothetical protein
VAQRILLLALAAWLLSPRAGAAQQPAPVVPPPTASLTRAWTWFAETSVFFGYNYQHRKFTDFDAWESQNWLMAGAARESGHHRIALQAMFSLEPLTLQDLGSPQAFQTGETYEGAPLIDYQHPHDFLMGLWGGWQRVGRLGVQASAAVVGSPALGPPVFMHRPSARDNPQVPLSHHQMDATHITAGVVTVGASARNVLLEGSLFHGRESDENRWDIDLGPLDSWSTRLSWSRGPWQAQVSGGRLHSPEATEPLFDVTRITASVGYVRTASERPLAVLVAWGDNFEVHGHLNAYLAEITAAVSRRSSLYGRAELVDKDILDAGGLHPAGFTHFHEISRVAAFTAGYTRSLIEGRAGQLAIGADATTYRVPPNLKEPYGSPLSFHIFLRYRGGTGHATTTHVH